MYTDQIRKLNNVFEKNLGLSITTSPDALELGNADIYIHFHNRGGEIFLNTIFGLVSKKFGLSKNSLIEKYGTILGKMGNNAINNCSVTYFNSGIIKGKPHGKVKFPVILINRNFISRNPKKLLPDCITEELGHALMFWADSDPKFMKNSMFASGPDAYSNSPSDFTQDELFLMKVLSDNRIRDGMKHASAIRVMWKIIAENLPYVSVNPLEYLHLTVTGKLNDYKSKNPKLKSILNKIDTSKI